MSSTRRVLPPYLVYNGSLSATSYSTETDVAGLDVLQYDLNWSAGSSLNYTVTVEALIEVPTPNDPTTWVWTTIDFLSAVTLTGTSGSHNLVMTAVPFSRSRLKFTKTAGDCTIKATIKGKGV